MDIIPAKKQPGPKFQLQNLSEYAILSWHAGLAPETGFSAPSMEQLRGDCAEAYSFNHHPNCLSSVRFAPEQTELQNLADQKDNMSAV